MVGRTTTNPPNTAFVTQDGKLTREAFRFLQSLNRTTDEIAGGVVVAGDGLTGGGAVTDGLRLSIKPAGVTNAMLRPSAACSVVGRFGNSAGSVADIVAVADNSVLMRRSGQLGFWDSLDGVPIGVRAAAPVVRTEALRIDQAPVAETITATHTITINVNGTRYKIPLVAAP